MHNKHQLLENSLKQTLTRNAFVDKFKYLTDTARGKGKYVTERYLIKKYQYGGVASMIARMDIETYNKLIAEIN